MRAFSAAAVNAITRNAVWIWRKGRRLAATVVIIIATAWATASFQESERIETSRAVATRWHAALVVELQRVRDVLPQHKKLLEPALTQLKAQLHDLNAGGTPAIFQLSLPYSSMSLAVWQQLQSPPLVNYLPVEWYLDVAELHQFLQMYAKVNEDLRTDFRTLAMVTGAGLQRRSDRISVTHDLFGHVELALALIPELDRAMLKVIEQTKKHPL